MTGVNGGSTTRVQLIGSVVQVLVIVGLVLSSQAWFHSELKSQLGDHTQLPHHNRLLEKLEEKFETKEGAKLKYDMVIGELGRIRDQISNLEKEVSRIRKP